MEILETVLLDDVLFAIFHTYDLFTETVLMRRALSRNQGSRVATLNDIYCMMHLISAPRDPSVFLTIPLFCF